MKKHLVTALAATGIASVISAAAFAGETSPALQPRPLHAKFLEADTDHDGSVSKVEFDAQRAKTFDEMDTNKDGVLTKDEILAHHAGKKVSTVTKMNEKPGSGDEIRKPRRDFFSEIDANNDGKVTKDEFVAAGDNFFARIDKNGDGKLDKMDFGHRDLKPEQRAGDLPPPPPSE